MSDLTALVKQTALSAGADLVGIASIDRFEHAPLDCKKCSYVHQGWDPRYSPFVDKDSSRENPPRYFEFLQRRFRHQGICVGRGCIRACVDRLEKLGKIEKQYKTPMIEGEQWVIEEPLQ